MSVMVKEFYVYLHRKASTGEVFYVGKGHGNRAYDKRRRSQHWQNVVSKHGYVVEFAMKNLDENTAFELEEHLINFYGRKDLNLGQLVNMTDGGEGPTGYRHSEESKLKKSQYLKGAKSPWFGKRGINHHTSKKVVCLTTGEIFESTCLAQDTYKADNSSISKCCNGKLKSAGKHPVTGEKLTWSYV